jgi:hypothetical protein
MVEVRIAIGELPPRTRALSIDELADVYGGCYPADTICDAKSNCCSNDCDRSRTRQTETGLHHLCN